MRIVYCTGALYSPGGAEKVLISKANYFANHPDFEVFVVTADQNAKPFCFPLDPRIKFIDASVLQFFPKKIIPYVTKRLLLPKIVSHYQSIIDEIQPDIIIVNELGYDDEVIPKVKTSAKKIREFHSSHQAVKMMIAARNDWKSRFQFSYINKKSYQQFNEFDCVVLLTESDRKTAHYKTLTDVIPNTLSKTDAGLSSLTSTRVISVGRLDALKNHIVQIELWKKIVNEYPEWTLHIYGEGPEKQNLQKLILDLGLENNVFLEGVSTNIYIEYQKASLFLFTSLAEGFGMVLIEAMSSALPCISFDCPCGPSEIIDDGINGFLIPMNNLQLLFEKTKELIFNDSLRKEMGKAGLEKSKCFLPEKIMPRWELLFNKLLDNKNG